MATLLLTSPALAAPLTFTVDDNGDGADQTIDGTCATAGNACTLRAAIEEANANDPAADTIGFAPSVTGSIVLTSALPQISDDLTINGPGASQLAIDGDNSFRVLEAQNGTTTSISGLTIRQGQAPVTGGTAAFGGGIVSGGDMTLDRVVVTDNHASVSAPPPNTITQATGAGILSGGTLTLRNSTVAHNDVNATASGTGQSFSYGGGIAVQGGTTHVIRSTISDNQATATVTAGSANSTTRPNGGGIYTANSTLTIDESTIDNNSATGSGGSDPIIADFAIGGGVYQDNGATMSVTGTTVSGNSVGVPAGPHEFGQGANLELLSGGTFRDTIVAEPVGAENCVGTFDSNGYNLEDDVNHECGFTHPTDIAGQDPLLGPLANNGGPTQTRKLLKGSPAVDRGRSFGAPTDQRGTGFPRIIDSPTIPNGAGDGSDIGAFERDSIPPHNPAILASTPKSPANNNTPKLKGLAEAGSLVRIYETANCTGPAVKAGSAAAFHAPGLGVSVGNNTSTVFHATATDSSNNTSACSSGFTYVEDSTPPNTSIDSLKIGHVYNAATVTFSSNENGSTFKCRIDAQPYASCTSPKKWAGLAPGPHTIRVFAIDQAGNADPTPAHQSFTM